jgi:2-hydroxy-3-oxopropionate reductase
VMEMRRRNFLEHDFTPGFRIDLHHKDLNIALETGDAYGVPLPVTGLVQQALRTLRAQGHGADDHSGLLQLVEDLAAHRIGSRQLTTTKN